MRSKPNPVDQPERTALTIVHCWNAAQYSSTENVLLIFPPSSIPTSLFRWGKVEVWGYTCRCQSPPRITIVLETWRSCTCEGCRESERRMSKLGASRIDRAMSVQLSRNDRCKGLSARLVCTHRTHYNRIRIHLSSFLCQGPKMYLLMPTIVA